MHKLELAEGFSNQPMGMNTVTAGKKTRNNNQPSFSSKQQRLDSPTAGLVGT